MNRWGSTVRKRFGVSLIGGSGYGAGEVLRFLSNHPDIEVVEVVSRSHAGNPVASVHSHLTSIGLPELNEAAVARARYITNPGCLATAAALTLLPLKQETFIGTVVIDAKTGTSGAGREPQASMHHPSRATDFTAYKALQHRHEPEILQTLGAEFSAQNSIMFVPHLIPISRGIFVTTYMTCATEWLPKDVVHTFNEYYKNSPFIRLRHCAPRLADVVGTNFCDVHVTSRGKQIVAMAALDNLGKGMAGQCIQNLHIMWGLSSNSALMTPALGPV